MQLTTSRLSKSAEKYCDAFTEKEAPVETVSCRTVGVIEGDSGVSLLSNYVGLIYRWAAAIVGMISVVIIIVSGVQISIAGGDTGKIDEAKKRIIQSLAGLIVLFLSGVILYSINPNFFTGG